MTFCLIHLPDFICLYRTIASIAALLLGQHPLAPFLFTTALLSDIFDGYIFRRFVCHHPAWRPWNPLPITFDPLADFVLLICGVLYTSRYLLHFTALATFFLVLIVASIGLILNSLPFTIRPRSALVYTICMTTLTHLACGLMIMAPCIAWYICYPETWPIWTIMTTLMPFYVVFFILGDTSRLIRRPSADFLNG